MKITKYKKTIVGFSTLLALSSPIMGFAIASTLDQDKTESAVSNPTFLNAAETKSDFKNNYDQTKSQTNNFFDFTSRLKEKIGEENKAMKMQKQVYKMALENNLDSVNNTDEKMIEQITNTQLSTEDFSQEELQKLAVEKAMDVFDFEALQASADFTEMPADVDIEKVVDSYVQEVNKNALQQFEKDQEMLTTIQESENEAIVEESTESQKAQNFQNSSLVANRNSRIPQMSSQINSKIYNIQTGDFFYQKDVDNSIGNIVGHSGIIKKINSDKYQIVDSWVGDGVRVGAFKEFSSNNNEFYFVKNGYMNKWELNNFIADQKVTVMRAQKLQWRRTWWIFGRWFWTDLSASQRAKTWDNAIAYVGRPYDNTFHNSYGIYCSELVKLAYNKVGVNLDYSHFYTGGLYTRYQIGKYLSDWIGGNSLVDFALTGLVSAVAYWFWPAIAAFTWDIVFPRELYLDSNSRIVYNYNDAVK